MSTSNLARTIFQRVAIYLLAQSRLEPSSFTATGGGTTSIVSTSANWSKTSPTAFNGLFATVTYDAGAASAAPEGESHVITAFVTATSTLTVGTYTAAVASGDLISLTPISSTQMFDCMNEVVRNLPLPRYLPLTQVTDGNMEATGTSSWAGTATLAKDTTTVLSGTQSLKVTCDPAEYVESSNVSLLAGTQVVVAADIYVVEGTTITMSLVDVTTVDTTLESDSVSVTSGQGWVHLEFLATAAAATNVAVVRIASSDTAAIYVDNVVVLDGSKTLFDLPSQITDATLVDSLHWVLEGPNRNDDASLPFSHIYSQPYERTWRDYRAVNDRRIQIEWYHLSPIWIEFRATNTTLTTMASVFYGSSDLLEAVVEGTTAECFKRLGNPEYVLKRRNYKRMLQSLGIGETIAEQPRQNRVYARGR